MTELRKGIGRVKESIKYSIIGRFSHDVTLQTFAELVDRKRGSNCPVRVSSGDDDGTGGVGVPAEVGEQRGPDGGLLVLLRLAPIHRRKKDEQRKEEAPRHDAGEILRRKRLGKGSDLNYGEG